MSGKQSSTEESLAANHEVEHEEVHVHGPNCNHHHHHEVLKPLVRQAPKVGRNDHCLCNSGKKYKKCCGQ